MPTVATEPVRPRAVLASVRLQGVTEAEYDASRAELVRLVTTLGFEVVGHVGQVRARLEPGVVFGKGKLVELARLTGGTGVVPRGPRKKQLAIEADEAPVTLEPIADVIVVDHELSPQQLRNLEKATSVEVMDRTGVIVEIFHRHARSREAKLQVEIARLTYLAPRLRETGGQRQRGGIGQKGAGESALELDRRKIRDRIAEIKSELAAIEAEAQTRRTRRLQAFRCALIGYTNAGKSSLMRALTASDVLVADKLFATLDTTVRALHPETKPKILLSDTVGFIKNLPHDLIASFRSTLDEALDASLLLHVVDAADSDFRQQMRVTGEVLSEIGAEDVPRLLVLNKADRIDETTRIALASAFPDALVVSAKSPEGVRAVREAVLGFFGRGMTVAELFIPWAQAGLTGEVRRFEILEERHTDEGTLYRVRGDASAIERVQARTGEPEGAPSGEAGGMLRGGPSASRRP